MSKLFGLLQFMDLNTNSALLFLKAKNSEAVCVKLRQSDSVPEDTSTVYKFCTRRYFNRIQILYQKILQPYTNSVPEDTSTVYKFCTRRYFNRIQIALQFLCTMFFITEHNPTLALRGFANLRCHPKKKIMLHSGPSVNIRIKTVR